MFPRERASVCQWTMWKKSLKACGSVCRRFVFCFGLVSGLHRFKFYNQGKHNEVKSIFSELRQKNRLCLSQDRMSCTGYVTPLDDSKRDLNRLTGTRDNAGWRTEFVTYWKHTWTQTWWQPRDQFIYLQWCRPLNLGSELFNCFWRILL